MHLSRVVQCFDVLCEFEAQSTCVNEGGVPGTHEEGYYVVIDVVRISNNCVFT